MIIIMASPNYSERIYNINTEEFEKCTQIGAPSVSVEDDFYSVREQASYTADRFTILPHIIERKSSLLGVMSELFQTPSNFVNDVEVSAQYGALRTFGHSVFKKKPIYSFTDSFSNLKRLPSSIEQLRDEYTLGLDVLRKTGKPVNIIPPERFREALILLYDNHSYEKDIALGFNPNSITEVTIDAGVRDNGAQTSGLLRIVGEKSLRDTIESYLL